MYKNINYICCTNSNCSSTASSTISDGPYSTSNRCNKFGAFTSNVWAFVGYASFPLAFTEVRAYVETYYGLQINVDTTTGNLPGDVVQTVYDSQPYTIRSICSRGDGEQATTCQGPFEGNPFTGTSEEGETSPVGTPGNLYYVVPIIDKYQLKGTYARDFGPQTLRNGTDDEGNRFEIRCGQFVIAGFTEGVTKPIFYYSRLPERQLPLPGPKTDRVTIRNMYYAVFSEDFGYGTAIGVETFQPDGKGGLFRSMTLDFAFSDLSPFKNFQIPANPITTPGGSGTEDELYLDTKADGNIGDFQLDDFEVVPLSSNYYLAYEGGVKDMRRFLR